MLEEYPTERAQLRLHPESSDALTASLSNHLYDMPPKWELGASGRPETEDGRPTLSSVSHLPSSRTTYPPFLRRYQLYPLKPALLLSVDIFIAMV